MVHNKIDTLHDELMSDDEFDQSIHKQGTETARLLSLDEQVIFPLSAKKGLIAKIKKNEKDLSDSRLASLENFLSDRILSSQKEILQHKVIDDVVENMAQVNQTMQSRLKNVAGHTEELRGISSKSEEATGELLIETRKEQTLYNKNVVDLKTSRHIFYTQIGDLLEVVNPARVVSLVQEGREQMVKSWTSVGIRHGMQDTFDGLNSLLNETLSTTHASVKLLNAIYKRFKDEHGIDVEQPKGFNIHIYQRQLDQLLKDGLVFSTSSSTVFIEQNTLAKRFADSVGGKAISIFKQAEEDVKKWKSAALSSLMSEVNEQKMFMESKLESLRDVSAGKDELDMKIAQNKALAV